MYKINKIKLGNQSSDGMKYKVVETTAGNFKTRCCAYNQTIERVVDIFRADTGKNLDGPPIKIWTLMYDPEFKSRQKFLCVKQLTESNRTKEEFHGCNIFENEVDFLKKRLVNFNKVVLVNYLIPKSKWDLYEPEDIISMVTCLCKTESPHITIPLSPNWNSDECLSVLEKIKSQMNSSQDYFLLMHPHMDILNQKIIVESLLKDLKFRGVLMKSCSMLNPNNAISYNQTSRMLGNERLFILVDVEDTLNRTKIPTALASRLFNVDITCRSVKPYLGGDIFDSESKKRRNLVRIYVNKVGGLLNENEQFEITGLSLSEYIAQILPNFTNISFRDLSICFNFLALNKEGDIEREMIDKDTYKTFIDKRIHLRQFIEKLFLKNP